LTICPSLQSMLHSYFPSLLLSRRPSALTEPVGWGPDNPHPLCERKTELVWDGKYDEYGNRRPVDVAGRTCERKPIYLLTCDSR